MTHQNSRTRHSRRSSLYKDNGPAIISFFTFFYYLGPKHLRRATVSVAAVGGKSHAHCVHRRFSQQRPVPTARACARVVRQNKQQWLGQANLHVHVRIRRAQVNTIFLTKTAHLFVKAIVVYVTLPKRKFQPESNFCNSGAQPTICDLGNQKHRRCQAPVATLGCFHHWHCVSSV